MPNYVIYDPASTPIANVVTQILTSFDEGREAELSANRLKDPNLSGVDVFLPMKVVGGAVLNLTAPEVQQMSDAREVENLAALKQAAKNIFLTPSSAENQAIALGFATVLEMMVSEINILRAQHSLAARTDAQVKTSFRTTYEARIDNLN